MKVPLEERGEEFSHLVAKVMRAKSHGQGQGQDLEADPEVGQAVDRDPEAGQGHGLSLAVGQDHALSQGQEVGQLDQSPAQGHGQGQSLVVRQGQGRNLAVLPGRDLGARQGLGQAVQQDQRSLELGRPQGHRQGQRSQEVKGHRLAQLIQVEGLGVKLKIECWNCKYFVYRMVCNWYSLEPVKMCS